MLAGALQSDLINVKDYAQMMELVLVNRIGRHYNRDKALESGAGKWNSWKVECIHIKWISVVNGPASEGSQLWKIV